MARINDLSSRKEAMQSGRRSCLMRKRLRVRSCVLFVALTEGSDSQFWTAG